MRYSIFAAAALGLGTAMLAGCGEQEAAEAEPAAEEVPGVTVSNARLILPAVAGNPGVMYLDIAYEGDRGLSLRALEVEGAASATFHTYGEWNYETIMQEMAPLPVQPGDSVSFAPEENHGMVFELDDSVKAGGTVNGTLVFGGAKRHAFEAEVRAAGDERE